jgi:hypothetical protein
MLDNKNLQAQIEGLRKEKNGAQQILESVNKKCQETEVRLENIRNANYYALKNKDGKISKINLTILFSG